MSPRFRNLLSSDLFKKKGSKKHYRLTLKKECRGYFPQKISKCEAIAQSAHGSSPQCYHFPFALKVFTKRRQSCTKKASRALISYSKY